MAFLRNAVVWIVSTLPPTSNSSRPFNNPLVIVSKAPITIGTIVTFLFHSFFNSLARSRYLSFFSLSFRFILWSAGTAKSTILQILFFFFVDYYGIWSSCQDDNYYYYYYLLLNSFSHQFYLMVFHWSLSDSKSSQVSRTLLSIVVILCNAVVWMVSIRPPNSKSSSPFNNLLVTVPKHQSWLVKLSTSSFSNFLARSRYLSFFSHSFNFILWSAVTANSRILQVLFFVDYYKVWSSGWD